jgi:hypothetical protein
MLMGTHLPWSNPHPIAKRQPIAPTYAALPRSAWPKNDAPAHCVVTGGNGLVGARLVTMLVERGAKSVVSLDLALPSAEVAAALARNPAYAKAIRHAVCDINDTAAMTQLLSGATAVFHTAALVGPYFKKEAYERVNHQVCANAEGSFLSLESFCFFNLCFLSVALIFFNIIA